MGEKEKYANFFPATDFFKKKDRWALLRISPNGLLLFGKNKIQVCSLDGHKVCEFNLYEFNLSGKNDAKNMRDIEDVHWMADNTILAVGPTERNRGDDGILFEVWDVATKQRKNKVYIPTSHPGHDSPSIYSTAFSSDYAAIGINSNQDILVFNTRTFRHFYLRYENTQEHMTYLAWSPDGTRLAAGGANGLILVWNLLEKRVVFSLYEHRHDINALAWLPCGGKLAAGSKCEQYIRVWNVAAEFHDTPKHHLVRVQKSYYPWDLETIIEPYPPEYGFTEPMPPCLVQMIPEKQGQIPDPRRCLPVKIMEMSLCRTKLVCVFYLSSQIYFYNFNTKAYGYIWPRTWNEKLEDRFHCDETRCISWFPDSACILIGDNYGNVLKVEACV